MGANAKNLVWIDMEMTGLNPESDRVLEVGIVITDSALNVLAEAPAWAVHQSDEVLAGMDKWNTDTHGKSGLTDRVKNSMLNEFDVQTEALAFLKTWVPLKISPMCGNSICQDRRFLARWMPELEAAFHYRNLDVSTVKELCKRWRPDLMKGVIKKGRHTALADVFESIEELRYYREHFIHDQTVSA